MRCASWRASRRRRSSFPVLLFLLAGPASAIQAADAGSAPGPSAKVINVTWPDIVQLVGRHPRFAAGRLQIDAARGAVLAAGAVPNPTVEGSVGQGRSWAGDATRFEWGLTLSVPLGWLAQRGSRIAEAEAEVDVAAAESQQLRRDDPARVVDPVLELGARAGARCLARFPGGADLGARRRRAEARREGGDPSGRGDPGRDRAREGHERARGRPPCALG